MAEPALTLLRVIWATVQGTNVTASCYCICLPELFSLAEIHPNDTSAISVEFQKWKWIMCW